MIKAFGMTVKELAVHLHLLAGIAAHPEIVAELADCFREQLLIQID